MVRGIPERSVQIPADSVLLEGVLAIPPEGSGVVLFAHGSGSSRHSPRNNFVAQTLLKAGIGTLLFDLLMEEEDAIYKTRFNIKLLTRRLVAVTTWLTQQPQTKHLRIGFFGASTGAAAALDAAAALGARVGAVVSRGGRPDLAGPVLVQVQSPTLLIVGGKDGPVIELNQQAYDQLNSEKKFVIVPGATHLFEEPGALEEVARLAADWFTRFLIQTEPE